MKYVQKQVEDLAAEPPATGRLKSFAMLEINARVVRTNAAAQQYMWFCD